MKFFLGLMAGYFMTIALVQADLKRVQNGIDDYLHLYNQCLHKQTLKGHKVPVAMDLCRMATREAMNDRQETD